MKKLHLICNAHLDTVWQWTWDEGLSAAIATFKSAADLGEQFDYIFCHNESILYEEIEQKAPQLFKRIKKLVQDGRWVITGGWYLQPDCLLPNGESIVRQINVGHEYFYVKFGVKPEIGINYDSFGHSIGLVQIMKKFGYKGYMICRPNANWQFSYPSKFFNWISPDGSSIVVTQTFSYNSVLGKAVEKIQSHVCGDAVDMLGSQNLSAAREELEDVDYVLWGVGNHGGGPSRKDLMDIEKLNIDGIEIIHSTPENLFNDNIKVKGEVKTSLVTCMPGCYSSMARVKQSHREAENLFYSTEKILAVAKMAGFETDLSDLKTSEKKLLLAQFHDILPGTSIQEGELDGLELLSMSKKISKDYRTAAFLYLVMGDKVAEEGEFPIFVFNYMPYQVETLVEVEFILSDQNWSQEFYYEPCVFLDGVEIPCQTIKEGSTLSLDWRKRIIFNGLLNPMGITRFSVKVKQKAINKKQTEQISLNDCLVNSGILREPVVLEMYDDTADPWGMSPQELKSLGRNPTDFRLMTQSEAAHFCGFDGEISPSHTIENGNIVTSIESLYTSNNTNAAIEYKFYRNKKFIDLKVTVEYAEKNKLVRLKIPVPNGITIGDGPYLVEEKPLSGEITFQKWVGVKNNSNNILSIINDGIYAGKTENGYICLTLLRGAGYCFHPIPDKDLFPKDRYLPRIENGRYVYKFRIYQGDISSVCAEAELFNQLPYALNVFPTGDGKKEVSIKTDKETIMPVFKVCDNGYIARLYNPEDEQKTIQLQIENHTQIITLNPYEIVSVHYNNKFTVSHDKIIC